MNIDPKLIPDEAWKAVQLMTGFSEAAARGLVAVVVEQWPGAELDERMWHDGKDFLILPLSKEGDA